MLLKAEDKGTFQSHIEVRGAEIWASYQVEGRVNADQLSQGDRRLFASEQEALNWLHGEAERRGFHDVKPEIRSAA
jgi:hypothetical protein